MSAATADISGSWARALMLIDERPQITDCWLQPRDVEILRALWAHHFLTTRQIAALWWSTDNPRAVQRRLSRLFAAGHIDRFRPRLAKGSFPWTYALTRRGFNEARRYRTIPDSARFVERPLHNFQYVIHDLELNDWAVAYRRLIGEAFLGWAGEEESEIRPPNLKQPHRIEIEEGLTIEGLSEPRPQPIRPDSVLRLELDNEQGFGSFLVEYDRTRRPDKIRRKLARYDAFLSWWWRHTEHYGYQLDAPYALFICQDEAHVQAFLSAADAELRGHEWAARLAPEEHVYPARERIVFVNAQRVQIGSLEAWGLSHYPTGHIARRESAALSTVLPGAPPDAYPDSRASAD